MSLTGRKYRWQRIFYSKITLAVLLVCCGLLALSVYERYTIASEMSERRQEREEEYKELQARKGQLEEKVEYLSGDAGIESELRRNFDVAKEGEEVVIIVDEEGSDVEPLPTSTDVSNEGGFWAKFLPW